MSNLIDLTFSDIIIRSGQIWLAMLFIAIIISLIYVLWRWRISKLAARLPQKTAQSTHQTLSISASTSAEDVAKLKLKFFTNLNNELRTPLALVSAAADKLVAIDESPDTQLHGLVIKRNVRRLLNLINQPVHFNQIEQDSIRLDLAECDAIGAIFEVADIFKDTAERNKIDFKIEADVTHFNAVFDQGKTERIVFNILSNAFKFTPPGGNVKLQVNVIEGTQPGLSLLKIIISDSGIGIPENEQAKIFDAFYQYLPDADIFNQGSGVGLTIAKQLVLAQGGNISVQSQLQGGSVFIIEFPITKAANIHLNSQTDNTIHGQLEQAAANHADERTDKKKPLILLVEDHDEMRNFLRKNLSVNYEIVTAENGKEGWQKALFNHPQLMICDITMPEMNGIDLCRKVKSDKRTSFIPVILLTATVGDDDQLKGLETGANDYMTKPFNLKILDSKIKNLLMLNSTLKDVYSKQIKVSAHEVEVESADEKLINSIVKYIEDEMTNPDLSVEELARHVGMSRVSLYHKTLEITGITPVEYIRKIKLERAAGLLEKSDYNVAQVAYMTGFATPSYFSRQFKDKYKMLPSMYIETYRKRKK